MNYDPIQRPWFYGSIPREVADDFLKRGGLQNGKFLLRKRPTEPRSYALSLCYQGEIIHYHIQHQPDGKYGIEDGPRFVNPVELVEYHRSNQGGLLTVLSIPCNRPDGVEPRVYTNVTYSELQAAAGAAMRQLGINVHGKLGNNNIRFDQFEQMLGMLLHTKQPWFHGNISRDEAESQLKRCGSKTGLFLIREREKQGSGKYSLCLCNAGKVYHYLLQVDSSQSLSIPSGPKFLNLMECVEYYLNRSDGLVCKLHTACPAPRSKSERRPPVPKPPKSPTDRPLSSSLNSSTHNGAQSMVSVAPEKIYDTVAMKKSSVYSNAFKGMKVLDISRLTLGDKLGQGCFGSVLKGVYKHSNGNKIEVAIKQLKTDGVAASQKSEIEREARIMIKLDHPHIVRIVGMCQQNVTMLVMELAPDGPLHKYLRRHKTLTCRQLLVMLAQVSEGMEYLDGMHFVHRDLAARNVLVVNPHFVKISDFGMSRAMGADKDYYVAERAGRWPLKWYAPECIYYYRFTTKSDVWSYGVTAWETLTFGGKPYDGLAGQEVVEFLEKGSRMLKPMQCPDEVYSLMKRCWEYQPENRPTFSEIKKQLFHFLNSSFPKGMDAAI